MIDVISVKAFFLKEVPNAHKRGSAQSTLMTVSRTNATTLRRRSPRLNFGLSFAVAISIPPFARDRRLRQADYDHDSAEHQRHRRRNVRSVEKVVENNH